MAVSCGSSVRKLQLTAINKVWNYNYFSNLFIMFIIIFISVADLRPLSPYQILHHKFPSDGVRIFPCLAEARRMKYKP